MKLFVFIMVIVSGCLHNTQKPTPIEEINYDKSVVRLTLVDKTDGSMARCTGTIVDQHGLVFTARHCTDNNVVYVLGKDGMQEAVVVYEDRVHDIAAIMIDGWGYKPFKMCEIVRIAEPVCNVRNTQWHMMTEYERGPVIAAGPCLTITATNVRPGYSGGPLISVENKCLMGIASRYTIDKPTRALNIGPQVIREVYEKLRMPTWSKSD